MTPATIVQRIIDLSLNENAPDTDLQTKALGWLNDAYKEAYNVAATYSWVRLYQTDSVAITAGVGTLPYYPKRILSVVDTVTKRPLKPSDIGYILEIDPGLERTGSPARYYTNGDTTLKTHPVNNTTLSIVSMPQPAELALDDAESEIKVPPQHHELLVWSALYQGMMFERGFGNDGMLRVVEAHKTQLMDSYNQEMRNSAVRSDQRVKYQDF